MHDESRWRLILMPELDGATQMAVDEAILDQASEDSFVPTLRLYSWKPGCLSLGYAQPVSDIDLAALEIAGWELVRRPTGGRAILHIDELTYAVILPLSHPVAAGSLIDSYQRLGQALLASLNHLGCAPRSDAHYETPSGTRGKAPVCFEVPSNYEITADGKKLIGSAQARRKNSLLQHGSLPLHGDLARITQTLAVPDTERQEAAERLLQHATTLEGATGTVHSWNTAVEAFTHGFQSTFGIKFQIADLSEREQQRSQELRRTKYTQREWNHRV